MICADIQCYVLKQERNRAIGDMYRYTVLCTGTGEKYSDG